MIDIYDAAAVATVIGVALEAAALAARVWRGLKRRTRKDDGGEKGGRQ